MIFGIGVDIVEIERFRKSLERFGERLPRRVLTDWEFDEYCRARRPANYIAMRFAAKEALSKALGTGFREGVRPCKIGVRHNLKGKPFLECLGSVAALMDDCGVTASHVSLTDENEYAVAYVVLEVN